MNNTLLKRLLSQNKRIVLPQFGAFIRKEGETGDTVIFSPYLRKDDGVVVQAISTEFGLDNDDSREMIREYISALKSALDATGQYYIEGVGVLKVDPNGAVELHDELPVVQPPKIAPAPESTPATTAQQQTVINADNSYNAQQPTQPVAPPVMANPVSGAAAQPMQTQPQPVPTPHSAAVPQPSSAPAQQPQQPVQPPQQPVQQQSAPAPQQFQQAQQPPMPTQQPPMPTQQQLPLQRPAFASAPPVGQTPPLQRPAPQTTMPQNPPLGPPSHGMPPFGPQSHNPRQMGMPHTGAPTQNPGYPASPQTNNPAAPYGSPMSQSAQRPPHGFDPRTRMPQGAAPQGAAPQGAAPQRAPQHGATPPPASTQRRAQGPPPQGHGAAGQPPHGPRTGAPQAAGHQGGQGGQGGASARHRPAVRPPYKPAGKTDMWLVVAIIAALIVIGLMVYGIINTKNDIEIPVSDLKLEMIDSAAMSDVPAVEAPKPSAKGKK